MKKAKAQSVGGSKYTNPYSSFKQMEMINVAIQNLRNRGEDINENDITYRSIGDGTYQYFFNTSKTGLNDMIQEELNNLYMLEREKKINEILK
jgi:hypothetical protein